MEKKKEGGERMSWDGNGRFLVMIIIFIVVLICYVSFKLLL